MNETLAPPRRVRVRVRRKRSSPPEAAPRAVAPQDVTRLDTSILPKISIVTSGETGQPIAPTALLPLIAVDGAPAEAAPTEATPGLTPDEPPADAPATGASAALEPVMEAPVADMPVADASTADEPAAPESPEESERSAPTRRMPTLAVMAALTQRTEPVASPAAEVDAEPSARPARPTVPVSETERLDVSADVSALDTGALDPTALAALIEDIPAPEPPVMSVAPAAEEPQDSSAPATPSSHQMWWPQAARRRAAPETRPIAAESASVDADAVTTAPRPVARRLKATRPVSEAQSAPTSAAPVAVRETTRDATPAGEDVASRRRRAASRQQRAEARRSKRATVLSRMAFAHAALAALAALVAVIAALRGPEATSALTVFGWSVTLSLIAGVGAAFGYACAQLGLPRLATLTLLLSQLGALAWALGLLGPRAALLALAPASVALALRGAGRLSAVAAGLAWLILFIVDEALTLTGALAPTLPLGEAGAALVDIALTLFGLWLVVSILISLYTSRMNAVAHSRAVEHVALLTEEQLHRLRMRTEDDAAALRQALADALRGEQPERVHARGALSTVGEAVNEMADRLIDLRYDRMERRRLESATRRLTRVIERAWLGLSWSWPDATGTIIDDLLALLRTPPPPDAPELFDENAPTGQVVAPHLFRSWRPSEPGSAQHPQPEAQPGTPSVPSQPSAPTLPSLWPSDAGVRLANPLELPPSPRWRSPDSRFSAPDETSAPER